MLTLEKHLDNQAQSDSAFELLKSIWSLNKNHLPNAQNAISFNFPHYSLHESSHSKTITKNIEAFLGQARIEKLSPTDTWLILMASHTHDLGMVVFSSVLERKWAEDEFQDYLNALSEKSTEKDLQKAASLLLDLNNHQAVASPAKSLLPLEIRKAVILVTADYFRKSHHSRSKEMLVGADVDFNTYANNFNLTGIPNRFGNVLGEIAYAHGIDFYSVFERLEYEADGFGNDKMHPRFVAYLLRLGDLLDVDDKRFNNFNLKVFSDSAPYSTRLHVEKHASIKHLLISPTAIEVTADCHSDEVYRIARDWFDWLQKEVEDQSREWSNISPAGLLGLPPTISRDGIKILYKSAKPKRDLMNLRFEISNKKVFEMFEGSAIYEYPGFVFIREIVQNAIDATKIQLWKQVQSGYYDNVIRRKLNESWDTPREVLLSKIKFIYDLPEEIWENFLIDLKLYWDGNDLTFILQDRGTGISEDDLVRMTKKVGESRSADSNFQTLKKSMPYWLKPTGAFGIGLQSLFLVTESFIIQTKSEFEDAKEIHFFSSKNGEYCRISSNQFMMNRGSKLEISINKEKFDHIFQSTFDSKLIENYDWFSDTYKNIFIHKVLAYISEELDYVHLLNVRINDELIKKSSYLDLAENNIKELQINRDELILVALYKKEDSLPHLFHICEDMGIGSEMYLRFRNILVENGQNVSNRVWQHNKYYVRDIPVTEKFSSYYKTSYFIMTWNFSSPESDKLLNISRNKFIEVTKDKMDEKFLNDILPVIIERVVHLFENNVEPGEESVAIEFFHIHLTALMNEVKVSSANKFYIDFKIPKTFVTKINNDYATFTDFFSANKFLVFTFERFIDDAILAQEAYNKHMDNNHYDVDLVLRDKEYFHPYMRLLNFVRIENYVYNEEGYRVRIDIYAKTKVDELLPLKCNQAVIELFFRSMYDLDENKKRRGQISPFETYYEQLAIVDRFDEFYSYDRYFNNYIVSPFRNSGEIKIILNLIKIKGITDDNAAIKDLIRTNFLLSLIPETLQEFVVSKNRYSDIVRSKESVMEAYLQLIVDIIVANRQLGR